MVNRSFDNNVYRERNVFLYEFHRNDKSYRHKSMFEIDKFHMYTAYPMANDKYLNVSSNRIRTCDVLHKFDMNIRLIRQYVYHRCELQENTDWRIRNDKTNISC